MFKSHRQTRSRSANGRWWNNIAQVERLEAREMLAADGQVVGITLQATDLMGTPITQVASGEQFLIKVFVEDRRGEPDVNVVSDPANDISALPYGFFEAYLNITYDSEGFDFDSSYPFQEGPETAPFNDRIYGNGSIDGLIHELGFTNFTSSTGLQPDPVEMLSFRMTAEAPGVYNMAEGFQPYFHFYDPVTTPEGDPEYHANGVPKMERLTGQAFNNAVAGGAILLLEYGNVNPQLTTDAEVYFEGINLEVLPTSPSADFEIRVVTEQTIVNTQGEVTSLPADANYIDEWETVYVEVYGKAMPGYAVQNAVVDIAFDPNQFVFDGAIGRAQDGQLKHNVVFADSTSTSGQVKVGFSSLFENVGDDGYGLLGRIRLRSLIEMPSVGEQDVSPITSSSINLVHASPTVTSTTSSHKMIASAEETGSATLEVLPVIYDADDDGRVGLSDFNQFVGSYGKSSTTGEAEFFDYNGDGKVGLSDFSLFVVNFGQSRTSGSSRTYDGSFLEPYFSAAPLQGMALLEGEPTVEWPAVQPNVLNGSTKSSPSISEDEGEPSRNVAAGLPGFSSGDSKTFSLENWDKPVEEQADAIDSAFASVPTMANDAVQNEFLHLISSQMEHDDYPRWIADESGEYVEQLDDVLGQWDDESGL